MKIFLTGGAGFVGRNLARQLISEGNNVTILDNLSNSSLILINDLIQNGVNFIKGDIRNFDSLESAIHGNELVIHLAAKTSVQESIENPYSTFDVNVNGTENVLKACIKHKIKNFIAISSAAVYGNIINSKSKITEEMQLNPISPYAKSKMLMERIIKNYSTDHKINSIILRLFNVYGTKNHQEFSGVISEFSKKILEDGFLKINGDGSNTRDFISLNDTLDAIQKAILKVSKFRAQIFNIGSGNSISVNELANLMMEISGKKLKIMYMNAIPEDIKFSNASIERAKKQLEFNPKISLRNGLTSLISTFSM